MSSLKTARRLYERCREAGDKSTRFIPYRVVDSSFYGRINAVRPPSLTPFLLLPSPSVSLTVVSVYGLYV